MNLSFNSKHLARRHIVMLPALCLIGISPQLMAAPKSAAPQPLVIESQVKGSQEQPKVLYIMPWQGINHPIQFDDTEMKIQLPAFKPIHPKSFQQQVIEFSAKQTSSQDSAVK